MGEDAPKPPPLVAASQEEAASAWPMVSGMTSAASHGRALPGKSLPPSWRSSWPPS